MKNSKVAVDTAVTPPQKKLKQARLPFMLISDVSPKTPSPQTRKRKLSVPENTEPVSKVGKISKENDVIEDLVLISDDDSKDVPDKETTPIKTTHSNPLVKLVDIALKKKQQKKTPKKRGKNKSNKNNENIKKHDQSFEIEPMDADDVEILEVEAQVHEEPVNKEEKADAETGNESMIEEVLSNGDTTLKSDSEDNIPHESQNDKSISDGNVSQTIHDEDKIEQDTSITSELTASATKRKLGAGKKKEERERERQEREKKRQQEKEERAKQRQEKEEQRKREREEKEEAKKREREEKEEVKRKEREEKEKQREMEKKLKEEKEEQKRKEKEDKEEQKKKEREAREEEKRKKQEAVELEKQEQELKKKKAAEAFVSFFVPKQKVEKDKTVGPVSKNSLLSSFTIKADMRLAPTCRVDLSDERRDVLDKELDEQKLKKNSLYLKELKNGTKAMSSGKTWPLMDKDDDVIIVEDELPPMDNTGDIVTCEPAPREKLRPKMFSFHQNKRPPYWGTWRKRSTFVKPRRPFGQDQKQLDYDVDSDEEWEEEQEGESLDGSVCGSDDEADKDEYEVDNEVFVPHGYLSDEEATMDEDDVLSLSPETQKAKLKHLEDEFESEMKKPTERLKPRLYGLMWETSDGGKPETCIDVLWDYFSKFKMILNDPTPLMQPSTEPEEVEKKKVKKRKADTEGDEKSPKPEKKKKQKAENKKNEKANPEVKKTAANQPGINTFLTKIKNS